MRIRLDPALREPLSAQLRDALSRGVERGRLAPGERLPSVRDLAAELDLAPNTVARAYRELEEAGLLIARGRHGTFVVDRLPRRPGRDELELSAAAERFARRAHQLGAGRDRALEAARRALGAVDAPAPDA